MVACYGPKNGAGTSAMVVHGISRDIARRADLGNRRLATLPRVPFGVSV